MASGRDISVQSDISFAPAVDVSFKVDWPGAESLLLSGQQPKSAVITNLRL